jgi:hypothetical protein
MLEACGIRACGHEALYVEGHIDIGVSDLRLCSVRELSRRQYTAFAWCDTNKRTVGSTTAGG